MGRSFARSVELLYNNSMRYTNNEIWVFLSHSVKDYKKVRLVRNILEEEGLRPLMFFLLCLENEEEIDDLIKREINCRTRFILCDSVNAQASKWVQKEVEYITRTDAHLSRMIAFFLMDKKFYYWAIGWAFRALKRYKNIAL